MQRLRLLTLASFGVLSACSPPDSALRVKVTVRTAGATRVRADCLKLTLLDGTTELKSLVIKRPADDTSVFGVRRGSDLPQTLKLQVSGLLGTCTDESSLKLNALGEVETGVFPESGVAEVELFLDPANSSLDGDRDGYVSAAKGGLDCRDDDKTVFPGAGQVCANTADTDCDGQGGCDDSECGSAAVCLDPPDRVVVTSPAATMLRYDCLGPVRVELQNASGPRLAIRDTAVSLGSSLAGLTVHATSNCMDTPVSALPIPYGSSFFEVYLEADERAFGPGTVTATAAQVATPGTALVTVHPQPVDHLAFASAPRTFTAGTCGAEAVVVEFRDVMNRRTDVDTSTGLMLSSTPGDVGNANIFFTDAACGVDGSNLTLQPGEGAVTLYVLARKSGDFTLRAAPSTGSAATQALQVLPAAATQLAFINMELSLQTTQPCSPTTLQVQLQDAFQNAATLAADLPVRITATGLSNVTFFPGADTVCRPADALTDYTIPAGASTLAMRATAANASMNLGTVRVAATNGAPLTAATQTLRVAAGPATHFTWVGTGQSPLAGVCSPNPITLQLVDATGSISSSSTPTTFTLSTAPAADASFRYFSNAGCVTDLGGAVTIPAQQSSTTIYFRGNAAVPSFELRGTGSSLTGPDAQATGNSIRPAQPARLVFVAPTAQSALAGACSATPFLANVQDQYGNLTSFTTDQAVTVGSVPAGVTVGSATSCSTGSTVQLLAGATQVAFNARHTVTSQLTPTAVPYALTATVSGFSTVPTASFTVNPGPSTLVVDTPTNGTATLVAGACQNVTLLRRDMYLNNAPTTGSNPVTFAFPNGTVWNVYPAANCMGSTGAINLNGTHTVSFSLSPRTTGSHMVTASIGTGPSQQTANLSLTVTPGAPSLVFETPATGAGTASAAQTVGGCTQVTVARKDAFGNDVPLAGAAGDLTFTLPGGTTAHSGTPCGAGNAIAAIPLTATDARATFYVKAITSSATGGPIAQSVVAVLASQTATLTLTVSPGLPVLSITAPAGGTASLTANQCQAVTLERRDSFNNLVPIVAGGLNITLVATGTLEAFSASNCTGAATSTINMTGLTSTRQFSVRSIRAGTPSYAVTLDGQTVPLSLTVSPGPLNKLVVEGLPSALTAGGCTAQVVVRRRDFWDNDITADPALGVTLSSPRFSFSSNAGTCASPAATANVTIANGSPVSTDLVYATATFASSTATTVTATSATPAATGFASCTVSPSTAHHLFFLSGTGTVVANVCSAALQVELRDQYENQLTPAVATPYALTLSSSGPGVTFFPQAGCMGTLPLRLTSAAPLGTFSFRPTKTNAAEVITVAGSAPVPNLTQSWAVTPAPATKLGWKASPSLTLPRFACMSAGILQAQDPNGNASATTGAVTVVPAISGAASATLFTDNTCTTEATTLTINSGQTDAPEFFVLATGSGTATLNATTSPLTLTAAPAQTLALDSLSAKGSVVVTSAAPGVEAGGCVELTLERRDDANLVLTRGATTVTATVPTLTPPVASLYTSVDCTGTAANTVSRPIVHGASTAKVYLRGRSGAVDVSNNPTTVVVTGADLNAGSNAGTTTLNVLPLVRRGSCDLTDTNGSCRVTLLPTIPANDITRSFVVFTATGRPATSGPPALSPADQNVECHLESSTLVEVVCSRAGSVGAMSVRYQAVSFGRDFANGGVSVQHVPNVPATATSTSQTIAAVDLTKSFILASNTMTNATGTNNDGEAFPLVRFGSATTVDIVGNPAPTNAPTVRSVSLQVVSFAGAAVHHVNQATPTAGPASYTVATNTTGNAFLLATAQVNTDTTDVNYMCKRRLKGRLGASNAVFHRGGASTPSGCTGDAVAAISLQRVSLPASAVVLAPADVTIAAGQTGGTSAAFTAVPTHRSIVFLSGQGPGGQAGGEAEFNSNQADSDDTGPFHALAEFTAGANAVQLTRTGTTLGSVFAPFVVTFDP